MRSPNLNDPTGNGERPKAEMPIASLRQFLVPDTPVMVQSFVAADVAQLTNSINQWVAATFNLIAVVGAVSSLPDGNLTCFVTYVAAATENSVGGNR